MRYRVTRPADAGLLVLAKAPVAGQAKTRLCPPATPVEAARIAAAALLDTLDAVRAVPGAVDLVAWTGRLAQAERRTELRIALAGRPHETAGSPMRDPLARPTSDPAGHPLARDALARPRWFAQRGDRLGDRIAAAHADAADRLPGRPVLQIGMDTPQLRPGDLAEALAPLRAPDGPDAVLGPASDGGWWALGLRDPRAAALVADVPTSRPDTGGRTLHALRAAGLRVHLLPEHRDVDTAEDALAVASAITTAAPGARFPQAVAEALAGAATQVAR